MVKNYFQDIVPPKEKRPRNAEHRLPIEAEERPEEQAPPAPERSIRNISPLSRRREQNDRRETPGASMPPRVRSSRIWMWIAASISILVLVILTLFVFRSTTVTVIPRSHPVIFDESALFTAYPAASAPQGTLSYTVEVSDLEDSEVVPSSGTEHAETKASGSVVVTNSYSTTPVKLVKDTRFQDPRGLIFRIPAEVVVPGTSHGKMGQVSVTVVADKPGDQYNIGPTDTFTVPGLKSNAAMYSGIRGHSTAAMTGGFVGDRPAVESGAMQEAQANIRTRIAQKIHDSVSVRTDAVIIPDLVRITFMSDTGTPEASGGVRVHGKAHVEIPIFPKDAYAEAIAHMVSADAESALIEIVPGEGYAATATKNTALALGKEPLTFTLMGQAAIVWHVDESALSKALAGVHEAAFQNVITTFPSIEEAHARIEPFWKSSFPTDPSKINIVVKPAATTIP